MRISNEKTESPDEIGPLLEEILRCAQTDAWTQGAVLHAVENLVIEFRRSATTYDAAADQKHSIESVAQTLAS